MTRDKIYLKRKLYNILQSLLIIAMMMIIMSAVGILIAGIQGLIISVLLGIVLFAISPKLSPALVLKMYRSRPMAVDEVRGLYAIASQIAGRAELARVPVLHYIPSRMMNAFSVGSGENAAIAFSDGLLRALNWNEITGVIAHEISHIRNDDLKIMGLADSMSRFTLLMANLGMIMLLLYVPVFLLIGAPFPVVPVLILVVAPRLSLLLQLALSRTREFDADLNAVKLTGDPSGLASALKKIDYYSPSLWDTLIMPGRKVPAPSVLRTHPQTEKRIERLMEMNDGEKHIVYPHHLFERVSGDYPEVTRAPGWKFFGLWH